MDIQLLLALVVGIATIVVLVLRTRLDAFAALLIAALVTGSIAGSAPTDTIESIVLGFGTTLGSIGIVIGLGVAVGKILEVSGGADSLARAFLKAFGKGREPWAMGSTGALVSIPVFCDSGFVIMNPLARSIARVKRGGYVTLALALGCGMTLTHHMVPPTPGPLGVAGILGVDLGGLILAGLLFSIVLLPVVVGYARWMGPQLESEVSDEVRAAVYGTVTVGAGGSGSGGASLPAADESPAAGTDGTDEDHPRRTLGAGVASLPLLVPLLLIVANTAATAIDRSKQGVLGPEDPYEPSSWAGVLAFIGNPVVALLIGLVLAVYVLLPRWTPREKVSGWLAEAAASAGLILLITGAGGGLGQVLRDTGVGDELASAIAST
ncbi:MAG: GntP family permease, partial [Nocardioides sp.]